MQTGALQINEIPTECGQSSLTIVTMGVRAISRLCKTHMRWVLFILLLLSATAARADLRITRDTGGYVEAYRAKYEQLRDRGGRVIIDGVCNSACTMVLGIVPRDRICVTPRASLGFHQAYYDTDITFGIKVASDEGTSELMSYYPTELKDWLKRRGGLTTEMKRLKNGAELWKIANPCPDEF
jgi:hypothetical protein